MLAQGVSEEVWTTIANSTWAIWRCRNEKTYGGWVPTFEIFQKFLRDANRESRIAVSVNTRFGGNSNEMSSAQDQISTEFVCHVDGSRREPWRGDVGFVVKEGDLMVMYGAAPVRACCPIQAEVVALNDAIRAVCSMDIVSYTFVTDNQILARACRSLQPPVEADWRAYREIQECWTLLKENGFECLHKNRCQNGLADQLAKAGSDLIERITGYTYPIFPPNNF